jgi:cation diffusion facilitator family transporter
MIAGIVGRSQALIADALNSLLDIVANIVVWLGIKIAQKPPDEGHPYGHGNADNLAAIFVGIVLISTGAYIGYEALHSIIDDHYQAPTYLATASASLTILIKEGLYRYTIRIGRKFRSPAVIANAYDHRSDVIVSSGVLAGIIIAQLKYPILDPIAGFWVALFILKQAAKILRENVPTLMVASPGFPIENELRKHIAKLDGVVAIGWIKGRLVGGSHYFDAAVYVESDITVRQGHDIASEIKRSVMENYPEVGDILIHIEPESDMNNPH